MRIAVHHPPSSQLPLSLRRYFEALAPELEKLGAELIPFTCRPPSACDVVWDPFCGGRQCPEWLDDQIRSPVVITLHGAAPFSQPWSEVYPSLREALCGELVTLQRLERWMAYNSRVSVFISPSRYGVRENCDYLGLAFDKFVVAHHGVDHGIFTPHGPAEQDVGFLHVAAWQPKKNTARLVEGWAGLPAADRPPLTLIVPGLPEGAVPSHAGLRVIRQPLEPPALARYYRGALAFVFPSLHETFGLPVAEAMACGCPVLTSACTALEELYAGSALLVDPRSVEAIREGLLRLVCDDKVRAGLRAAGLKLAAELTWERSARAHLDAFRAAADKHKEVRAVVDTGRGYYHATRPDLAALIPASARRILDIGCGAGGLGRLLKERQPCWVTGVELVPAVAEQARGVLDEVLVGDAETIVQGRPPQPFDCVVCGDVLEHLRDPGRLLQRLREDWLAPGGLVVASVPNVRHWSVIQQLLEGRWDYADAGLLDRTHLRFFTRTTLYFLFAEAGFQIMQWQALRVPGLSFPAQLLPPLREVGLRVNTLQTEAEDYQYIVVARPKPLPAYGSGGGGPTGGGGSRADRPVASIVIPVWNGLEYTRQCVESILAHTRLPFELVIVDNGSTDGTPAYLSELRREGRRGSCRRVRVVRNDANLGFGPACNQGMAEALGDYIVLLNNDTVVTEGWLERMRAAAERDARIGVVGPRSNYVAGPQVIEDVPYAPDDPAAMERFAAALAEREAGRGFFAQRAIGLCLLIKRQVIDRIGGFDPRFGMGNCEDDDFSIRVLLAGFAIWIASDVFIHHHGNRTFRALGVDYGELLRRNLGRLLAKWGVGSGSAAEAARGYPLGEILARHVFVPELHYEPLSPAELDRPGLEPPAKRARCYLALPRWDDPRAPWPELLERYLRTFGAEDDVALLLRVDPTGPVSPEEVVWRLHEVARERGLDLEGGAEIVLVDEPLGPLDRGRLYRAADVLVAPELADGPHVAQEAAYFGLAVQSLEEAFRLGPVRPRVAGR